jgi:predicted nucleic-acid-binding Zn-ribbon protein
MNRLLCITFAAALLAGCSAAPKSSQNAADSQPAPSPAAMAASAPKEIVALTNQTKVWECPKCGSDFDGPGTCNMDGATLVEMNVSYICPADNQPVEHSGKCPRCAANARVEKVAVAMNSGGK